MINPDITEAEAEVEYARLVDELEAARLEMKDGPEQHARHARASVAMVEFRQFWRGIGELVDHGHPAKRIPGTPAVRNNDGSVK